MALLGTPPLEHKNTSQPQLYIKQAQNNSDTPSTAARWFPRHVLPQCESLDFLTQNTRYPISSPQNMRHCATVPAAAKWGAQRFVNAHTT